MKMIRFKDNEKLYKIDLFDCISMSAYMDSGTVKLEVFFYANSLKEKVKKVANIYSFSKIDLGYGNMSLIKDAQMNLFEELVEQKLMQLINNPNIFIINLEEICKDITSSESVKTEIIDSF